MAQRREVGLSALSWSLYPGAILWGFQLWVSYGLVNVACGHGFDIMFHLVTLFFAGLTGLTILYAYHLWRDLREGAPTHGRHPRAEFMALSGVTANSLFLLLIVVGGIPSFVFDPCLG